MSERIQKVLARQGLGSRREIEGWILEGRIQVDGKTAQLGQKISEGCKISLDGQPLKSQTLEPQVLMYHKPEGELCAREQGDTPTIFDRLPKPKTGKWISVGRLDLNSSGLLLITNDGAFADQLMHPRHDHVRIYKVRAYGPDLSAKACLEPVLLEEGPAQFESCKKISRRGENSWFEVSLRQGRYRIVRRIFQAHGLTVNRLIRLQHGPYKLPKTLLPGQWHEIKPI